ncbi:MAG: flagellar hook-length control protein FliK [Aquabacterium sp.]|uniref:flagellar hook-length control protein FliK n=1 Tax=Aquabacterium sp. TaxID=1872578 RepID=UPI0025BDFC9F|nr:flagellar hook-length control protein FliK [Aquabacterium sp.]MBI3381724.1 flagellar hook-length control protein FliK [Aquabacterium sp.]
MSMRLATLSTPLTDAPATREAAPASNAPDGSFNHAMNDARQADAPAPTARPDARKAAPGTDADQPIDSAPAGDPTVAALLAQFLAQPSNTAANMPAMPLGMQQAGTTLADAHADADANGASTTLDGANALSGMNAALSPVQTLRMASSGLLAGLSPAARALDKGQQAVPANQPGPSMAGLSTAFNTEQGKLSSAQPTASLQSALSSFNDASHSGDANRADTPSSAPASGAPANWAAVMTNLNERPAGASGQAGAALALPSPSPEHWKEPLLNTLGERVQWQIQRGSEQALIRLEPHHLGQIDIVIRQEAGQMQVHLSATHREVAQQLQSISDGLRQELSLRQAADVQVQVSDQSTQGYKGQGQRQSQQDAPAREPGRALNGPDDQAGTKSGFSMQADQG